MAVGIDGGGGGWRRKRRGEAAGRAEATTVRWLPRLANNFSKKLIAYTIIKMLLYR